jgi:hypothetical protein
VRLVYALFVVDNARRSERPFRLRPPMTTQDRHFDFFHSAAGRLLFAAAAIIVFLFFAFTYVVLLLVW